MSYGAVVAHRDLLTSMLCVQNPWYLVEAFVLLLDFLRLYKWPFYTERAIRMMSSLRAVRMVTLSEAIRNLLIALLSAFGPITSLLFVGKLLDMLCGCCT